MATSLPTRIVVYAKDVENITGRKPRTARRILRKVRDHFGKKPGDFVTVMELCEYLKLEPPLVREFLSR